MRSTLKKTIKNLGYNIYKDLHKPAYRNIFHKYKEFTMIPENLYCENLYLAEHFIPLKGDIVECGVWRGGMIAGIAEVIGNNRTYHLFDSFEGLPQAKEIDGVDAINWQQDTISSTYYNNCTAEIDYASKAMELTKTNYQLNKGWFHNTLPNFDAKEPIALLRLDGDWYDSTMDCLQNLYPLVIHEGLIILDDYLTWDGCSRAVHDYLSSIQSLSRISTSKNGVCYIIKKDEQN